MKSCRTIPLLPGLCLFMGVIAPSVQGQTPEELIAGIGDRIDQIFQAESGDPYALVKVKPSLDAGRPYYARGYSWSVVGYAARCFYLNESLTEANGRLQQNARYYLRELTAADKTEILPTAAENNTSTYSRIVDRDSLHWHADMVLRLIEMYGANGTVAPGRMDPATEAKCLEPIWHYVRLVSRLEKAEFQNSKTWHLWESENHHAQCFSIAWHFSKIAKDHPDYKDLTFTDVNGITTTLAELYEAWNAYFIEYVRERFRKGIFVEMRSDGYNSESIRGIYNFYDFGDADVRSHAEMYLDLFWAYWAQEQFNDISGGGKSRFNYRRNFIPGHGGVTGNMAWLYFQVGVQPGLEGGSVNSLLSGYRPPAVVADIATDIAGRGTYEVRQTAQGLGLPAQTNWDQSRNLDPYRLNTDGGGIVRYTYCDPAFIMGTPMVEARPANDWTAISRQGRWQGVIFSETEEAARIVPLVTPNDNSYTLNAFWSVQEKGSMITQRLNTSTGGDKMWAWISKAGLSDPVEEDGIIFVETDSPDGAYAAIRPVGTGYTMLEDTDVPNTSADLNWVVQLADRSKPLILEVMTKDQVGDFDAFKALVKANTPDFTNNLVTYTTIYGDVLTFDASFNANPTVNGVPVDYTPDKSYDSPFLHGDYNGHTFTIEKGSRQEVYTFPVPPQPTFTVVQSGSHIDGTIEASAGGKTITVNAGAADFLIVGTSSEMGGGDSFTATYDGNPMTLASGNGSQSNLFYLDLTQTAYAGGNANLTFTWNYTAGGDLAVGWVSIDSNLRAGESIILHQTGFADSSTNTVSLVTTVDDTFNFVTFNGNKGNDGSAPLAPLTEIYSDGDFGSNAGAAGYETDVGSGTHNYSWNHDALRRIDAAAFAVAGDYSVWVGNYPGVVNLTDPAYDSDLDGIANGIEAWFGTHPGERSPGLASLSTDTTTTTFTHPQSGNPPTDLSLFYQWSANLVDWYDCDGISSPDGGVTTVNMTDSSSTDGTTTVTIESSASMNRLFLRPGVQQN